MRIARKNDETKQKWSNETSKMEIRNDSWYSRDDPNLYSFTMQQ